MVGSVRFGWLKLNIKASRSTRPTTAFWMNMGTRQLRGAASRLRCPVAMAKRGHPFLLVEFKREPLPNKENKGTTGQQSRLGRFLLGSPPQTPPAARAPPRHSASPPRPPAQSPRPRASEAGFGREARNVNARWYQGLFYGCFF